MVDYNCCGTRPIQDDILSQSDDADDRQYLETVTATKLKLSLHLSKERKEVLSPSNRLRLLWVMQKLKNLQKAACQRILPAALVGWYVYSISGWKNEISAWMILILLIWWRRYMIQVLYQSTCSDLWVKWEEPIGLITHLKLSIKCSMAYFAIQESISLIQSTFR